MTRVLAAAFAGFLGLAAHGAVAQELAPEMPAQGSEVAPGVPALGTKSDRVPVLAMMGTAGDPMAYPSHPDTGAIGAPGLLAFETRGMAEPDIATGSIRGRR